MSLKSHQAYLSSDGGHLPVSVLQVQQHSIRDKNSDMGMKLQKKSTIGKKRLEPLQVSHSVSPHMADVGDVGVLSPTTVSVRKSKNQSVKPPVI